MKTAIMEVLQKWIRGPMKGSENDKKLHGKVALITGATSGIGKEVAVDLASRGARVLILCRDQTRASKFADEVNAVGQGQVIVYPMDLSSMVSVQAAAKEILANESVIHYLINNAGVMMCPFDKTIDGFERQFATNHLGHFLLDELLLPRLESTAKNSTNKDDHPLQVRIVITSSVAHNYGIMAWNDLNSETFYNSGQAYAQSKLANVLHANYLARKLKDENINVYSVHPGVVVTDLFRHWMDYSIIRCLMPFAKPFMKTPLHGAQTTLFCVLDQSLENETGNYYQDCKKSVASSSARNEENQEKLYQLSKDMTQQFLK